MEKNALEGVEANESATVVRLHDKKDDRRNKCDVGQHPCHVVGEPACRGLRRSSRRSSRAAACWTNRGTIRRLSATHSTKCHTDPPCGIRFETRPENGRTLPEMIHQGKRNRTGRPRLSSRRMLDSNHWPGGGSVNGADIRKLSADSAGISICWFPVTAPPNNPAPAPHRAPMPAPLPPPAIPPINAPPAAPPPVVAAVRLPFPLTVFSSTAVWIV